ncbi:MAG TPA: hypothetical protein VNS52_11330 [Gemmatimonadaceae bacterium]|nr:hypothetical protein [Gemmatimonadaceae bacterium]
MTAVLSDMPITSRARRALVLAALVAVPAAAAGAQGSVPGAIARRAAQNAVAATNAHTEAMTSPAAVAAASAPAKTPAPTKTVAAKPHATKPGAAATTTPVKGATATPAATAAGANAAAPAYAARSKAGTPPGGGTTTVSVTERNAEGTLTFQRETFEYSGRGRRDPFVSLIKSGELRPLFSDLKLVTVLYDPTGRNSVAIMHDVSTKDQYRVKVGQTLGRMRVSQIQPKQVVFAIEEFGYGRQAVLALNDSTKARKQ